MRMLALILISAISLASSSAFAASYQQIGGPIVDPIQVTLGGGGGNHPYSGANLRGGADLTGAILLNAFGLSSSAGAAFYGINTDFTGTGFAP